MQTSPKYQPELVERVRQGMEVVDASGKWLGTVKDVKMGDPQAATTQGQDGMAGEARGVVGLYDLPGMEREGPDVPDPLRAQLVRLGYIEVAGPEIDGDERYVRADRVAEVFGTTVRLRDLDSDTPASPSIETLDRSSPEGREVRVIHSETETDMAMEPELRPMSWVGRLSWVALGAVAMGAAVWWYVRWQHERNRPRNRLRRGLRPLVKRLPARDNLADYVPTPDDGRTRAGTAVLTLLALRWLLSRRSSEDEGEQAQREAIQRAIAEADRVVVLPIPSRERLMASLSAMGGLGQLGRWTRRRAETVGSSMRG